LIQSVRLSSKRRDPLPRRRALGLLVLAALVLGACGSKPEDQQATDELNAGLAASAAGNTAEAKNHYLACVKHNAMNQFCIYNLGVLAMRAGNVLEAQNDYRLALLLDPAFPSALFNLAFIQSQAGNPVATQEAIALYRRFVEVRPAEAGGHLSLGVLLIENGDVEAGNAEIALAKTLDPTIVVPPLPSSAPTPSPVPTPSSEPSPAPSA